MQTLNNTLSMFPEFGGFEGTVKQVLAMADIILDQVLRSLQGKIWYESVVASVVWYLYSAVPVQFS